MGEAVLHQNAGLHIKEYWHRLEHHQEHCGGDADQFARHRKRCLAGNYQAQGLVDDCFLRYQAFGKSVAEYHNGEGYSLGRYYQNYYYGQLQVVQAGRIV